mgnify:CR=1 FL=1
MQRTTAPIKFVYTQVMILLTGEHSDCSRGTFCDEGVCEWCYGPLRPCCQTNSTDTCILDEKYKGGFSDELSEEKNRKAMCDACTTSKRFTFAGNASRHMPTPRRTSAFSGEVFFYDDETISPKSVVARYCRASSL